MTMNYESIAADCRNRADGIPQIDGEQQCAESRLLYLAASAIEQLHKDKLGLERLVAELGETASAAGFYAGQVENSAREAGRRAASINAKAMNYFDPTYRKGDFA